jgi:hypothetical protein
MTVPVRETTPYRDQVKTERRAGWLERRSGGSWIDVLPTGDPDIDADHPGFTNGSNFGGGYQDLRFRWLMDGNVEIEGVVTGVSAGDVIFTLPPPLYTPDLGGNLPVAGVDPNTGLHVGFEIRTNGDVVFLG